MKNYDAKDAWLVIDGKKIFGFGDDDKDAINLTEVLCIRPTKLN